jgi:hypothetical protein
LHAPSIADGPDAHDIRIVYTTATADAPYRLSTEHRDVIWWRYQTTAPTRSDALTPFRAYYLARAVAFGDDTLVLANAGDSSRLGVVRVAPDGRIVAPFHAIAASPSGGISDYHLVRRGPDVIVSFINGPGGSINGPDGRINLARLTP